MIISKSLIAVALLFASHWSGLPIPPTAAPHIEQAAQYEEIKLCNKCATRALTNETGEIFLDMEWQEDNIEDQCILTHELVHYLQHVNHVAMTPATAEPPAYFVQAECLRQFHGDTNDINFAIAHARLYQYGNFTSSAK